MVVYHLSLNTNSIINWPINNQATTIHNLEGIENFFKTDSDYPSSKDTIKLDQGSSGRFLAGENNDRFIYENSIGRKNTLLDGGNGEDSLVIGFNAEKALQILKEQNYSLVKYDNGLGLRTNEGEEVTALNIEKVSFRDQTYNLHKAEDVKALVEAFNCKGITIIDKTSQNNFHKPICNCGQGLTTHHPQYQPIVGHIPNNRPLRIIVLADDWDNGLTSNHYGFQNY